MGLKKARNYDLLTTSDRTIVAIACCVRGSIIEIGLLGINLSHRAQINNEPIELFDRDSHLICKIKLDPNWTGDRHGYLPSQVLKVCSPTVPNT